MADHSKIEWTEATWSPTLGCRRVSEGCDGCYAIRTVHRMAHNPHPKVAAAASGLTEHRDGRLDWTGAVRALLDRLDLPLRWRRPRRIFVDSQSDLFHSDVSDEFIGSVFDVMARTPQHTYQILTKRPGRMRSLLCRWAAAGWTWRRSDQLWCGPIPGALPNVWLGVSVETQQWADVRIPALLDTPAAVRWLSCEPLLGPVDLSRWLPRPFERQQGGYWLYGIDPHGADKRWMSGPSLGWVVVGGESGPRARPMDPHWARSLRDQCEADGVPFYVKQWGEWVPYEEDAQPPYWRGQDGQLVDGHQLPADLSEGEPVGGWWAPDLAGPIYRRVGKKAAGRELDGRTWDQYPGVAHG